MFVFGKGREQRGMLLISSLLATAVLTTACLGAYYRAFNEFKVVDREKELTQAYYAGFRMGELAPVFVQFLPAIIIIMCVTSWVVSIAFMLQTRAKRKSDKSDP